MFLNFDSASSATKRPNPPSRAPVVLAVTTSLYLVSLIFVCAQIFVKTRVGKIGAEDYLIVIASTLLLVLLVFTVIACRYGFGLHMVDFNPEWILPYGRIAYTLVALATPCFAVTKLAMISFYMRFATSRWFRIVCQVSIAYVVMTTMTAMLVNLFGCKPISGAWDRRPGHPSECITNTDFYLYATASNIATDALLLVLPIPIVLRLRVGWGVKLGLMAMFSMGFIVTAVSTVSMRKMVYAIHRGDITWDGSYSWMFSLLELDVGIMTTCMPGMRLFLIWMRGEQKPIESTDQDDTIGGGPKWKRRHLKASESGLQSEMDEEEEAIVTMELSENGSVV